MFVQIITLDRWDGVFCDEIILENPSLTQFYEALDQLDAKKHTIMMLSGADASLTIGGGSGQYIVYVSDKNETIWNLKNPIKSVGTVRVNIGGQEGDYDLCQIIPKPDVYKAACTFFQSGLLDADLVWVKEGGKTI